VARFYPWDVLLPLPQEFFLSLVPNLCGCKKTVSARYLDPVHEPAHRIVRVRPGAMFGKECSGLSALERPWVICQKSVARAANHWLKIKKPQAPAVKREAEEDWGAKRTGRGQRLWSRARA